MGSASAAHVLVNPTTPGSAATTFSLDDPRLVLLCVRGPVRRNPSFARDDDSDSDQEVRVVKSKADRL